MRNKFYTKRHGFTIVEIMIALVVLVFGLYGVMDLFYNSDTLRTRAVLKQQATLAGVEKLETLKAAGYDNLKKYIEQKNAQVVYYPEDLTPLQQNPRLEWRASLKKSETTPDAIEVFVVVNWGIDKKGEVEQPKNQNMYFTAMVTR